MLLEVTGVEPSPEVTGVEPAPGGYRS